MYNNEFAQEFEAALGQEQQEYGSHETYEFNPEFVGEMSGETFEMNGEQELNETQEMELAHELLEVSNEQELNMFLGKLIKSAGRAVGNFARSSVGRGLGNILKTVAKKALPIAGGALGSLVGGPLGGMIGNKLGSAASNLFELELEGLSPEDQEFEMARAYVRFANSAASRAANMQRRRPGMASAGLLRLALGQAARQHAPGLLRQRAYYGRRPRRGYAANGYAPQDMNGNGFDQNGFGQDGNDDNGSGGFGMQGTWTRRGRTLTIQL
ncbi:hypothetical protein SAMN02745146_3176 [Hymenobacter daecheongensis DSM 21074]|uniref:Uncharacterized protein n=1 Tax=Hymenobacter daecheongensis DSM 21074 TaxID=1121955 RepID=A0A1M6JKS6_9BACT|nr:hypothetical protein [Hymenobacter daecheongensis]SHJ47283.1 hypothetical protein SAMN02745146_3176 [Hymenobacter daecheongensis DSM 21074]